ncbi:MULTISPECIES: replication initiation protein [Enterococcus]|uniref:replication initiation protein n=1 Tax=Enterococcus TaxID=1350 RepID=UPI000A387D64|nr:replication initiation protein [Enterococcus sp. 4E1_DIV0656]OTO09315.1 hypothetical protein A5882_003648 [Enterococcus sp. 4E1_DIV0656]
MHSEQKAVVIEKINHELQIKYQEQMIDIIFEGTVTDERTGRSKVVPFTAKEIDAFYAIIGIMNDEGTDFIQVPNSFIRKYTNDRSNVSIAEYDEQLAQSQQKIASVTFRRNDDEAFISIPFFKLFVVDKVKQETMAQANDAARTLILNVLKNYTSFEMSELASLRRVYSKILYIKLKAAKELGEYEVDRDSFVKFMNASNMSASDIKKTIINRSIEELGDGPKGKKIFKNLDVELIQDPNDRRRWHKIKFTFDKQLKEAERINDSTQLQLDFDI